jgi:CRP/FNR family transcriptional regulator
VLAPGVENEDLEFLGLLSKANRDRVLEGSTRGVYAAGTVIYDPGSTDRVFLLEHGLVRGYTSVPDGRQASIIFFHSGELIGSTLIVSHAPRLFVQIVTKSAMRMLVLEQVRNLARTDNEFLAAVAVSLAARLRNATKMIAIRSLGDIRQRLAYDLLERACRTQVEIGRLEVQATHADLANSIGSAREVVGRTLTRLRAEGIIETAPGMVRVVDPLRLAGIVRAFAI